MFFFSFLFSFFFGRGGRGDFIGKRIENIFSEAYFSLSNAYFSVDRQIFSLCVKKSNSILFLFSFFTFSSLSRRIQKHSNRVLGIFQI